MLRSYKFIKLYFLLICVFFINTSVCASLYLPKNNQILRSKKGSIDDIEQDAFNYQIKTIVIDAGHGGHDTGAKGSFSLEKDNSLAIALKVGRLIKSNYPNIRVIYTRTTDVFIPLMERAAIANRNKADLFMSIHCNSTRLKKIKVVKKVNKKSIHTTKWVGDSSIFGTETYVLGLHRTKDNLEVASRENQVILLEEDKGKKYEKFDIDTPEGAIMYSLMASQNLEKSILFASKVEENFTAGGRLSRGVQQAGFLVLVQTSMPAVLIEVGFMTNPKEEAILTSNSGRNQIAQSIFSAFKEYKSSVEKLN